MYKKTIALILVGVVGCIRAFGQCTPTDVTVVDYCNNQYAEFFIDENDDNIRYQWFSDAAGQNSLGYGPYADGKYFYSPNTYASGSGPQQFWIQKQLTGVTGGAQTATFKGASSGPFGGKTNAISVDSDFDFTLNSVTVPFHSYGAPPAGQYGVKIKMDGTTSNWYYFSQAALTDAGNNIWMLKIPIDINGLGQGIPVTAGTNIEIQAFAEADGTEAAGTQFLDFAVISNGLEDTYTIGTGGYEATIDQGGNPNNAWPAGDFGFFDWDITMKCPLETVDFREQTDASQCCVPVTNIPELVTNTGVSIYDVPVVGSIEATNVDAGHYFKWYKDGEVFSEGVGVTNITINDLGKYFVVVSELERDIDKFSCGALSQIKKIREKQLFIDKTDTTFICLGESVDFASRGGQSDWKWTTTGGGNVNTPNEAATSWTPNAEGVFDVEIEAMVPEGDVVVNGDFEDGVSGFEVSSKMREAPWTDVTNKNVPGCGNGPNLIFRNYGVSGNGNGVYTVGNVPPLQDVWCFNGGVMDHTFGTGNFFMMDGIHDGGWQDLGFEDNYIWQQKLVVEKNNTYEFSAWFASLDVGGFGPPNIKFFVNGQEIGITDPLDYSEVWDKTAGEWNSGGYEGEVTISIMNATNVDGGNDFAMDDIMFSSGNALQTEKTVVVVEDCPDPCFKPLSVEINLDSLKICDQEDYNHTAVVVEDAAPKDGYFYSWFKDGAVIVAPNTTAQTNYSETGVLNASDGWYKIRVEDGKNGDSACYLEDSIYLSVHPIPDPFIGNDTSMCFGGSMDLDAGPGPGPGASTYRWTPNGETTQTINVVESGTYEVTITTAVGCEESDEIVIQINPEVLVDLGPDVTVCAGETVNFDAGPNWESYSWKPNGEDVQTISVNESSEVSVIVEDNLGCEGWDTVVVEVKENPVADLGPDITVCAGPVELKVESTIADIDIVWNTGETTESISVNENGTNEYWVEISAAGCLSGDTVLVSIDSIMNVDFGPDSLVCEDAFPIEMEAGDGFASYAWVNTAGDVVATTQSHDFTIEEELGIVVVDQDGCVGYDTLAVIAKPLPDATINLGIDTITICPTSPPVTLTAFEPGANYNWTPTGETTQSISNNAQGWYSVVVDLNGCLDEDSIYINISDQLDVYIGPDALICPGNEVGYKTSFAGYSHNWNDGTSTNETFTVSDEGMVTVYVADAGGCEGWDTAFVSIDNPLKIDLGPDLQICDGDNAEELLFTKDDEIATVVQWSTGETTKFILVDNPGEYWIEIDSLGCKARDTMELIVNAIPNVDLGPDTFICKGVDANIVIDAGLGFANYTWSKDGNGTNQIYTATNSGEFKVTIVDTNGCVKSDSLTVFEEISTPFELLGGKEDTTICPLGEGVVDVPVELIGLANSIQVWEVENTVVNNGGVSVSNKQDGELIGVTLQFTNEFGCLSFDTVTVIVKNEFEMLLASEEACVGMDMLFDSKYPANGYEFIWNQNPTLNENTLEYQNVQLLDEGKVELIIVDERGCSGDTIVDLTVKPLPEPVLVDTTICEGETFVFSHGVNDALSQVWSTDEIGSTVSISAGGPISVVVTGANGCVDSIEGSLGLNPAPEFEITQFPDEACIGDTISLGTGLDDSFSHLWAIGAQTTNQIDVMQDGDYGVEVTNNITGCKSSKSKKVVFKPWPNAIIESNQDTIHLCEGEKTVLYPNTTPYTISWVNMEENLPLQGEVMKTGEEGTYILNVDNQGCLRSDTIFIDVHELPLAPLGPDTTVCFLEDVPFRVSAARTVGSYFWNTGDTTSSIIVSKQGRFTVDITNDWGCTVTDDYFVDDDCPHGVYLPNAFTPNNDGLNDKFVIMGHNLISVEVMIFDRWGMLLWTGDRLGAGWDGTFQGRECQIDVYVWKMKYSFEDFNEKVVAKQRKGRVTLLR